MAGVRQTPIPSYRRLVKKTLVAGLREVFNSTYLDEEFRDLRITASNPVTEADYPSIVVRFNPGRVQNAGIGHYEYFTDTNGSLRQWLHRWFDGSVDFDVMSLSPLSRDVLVDALMEILTFGHIYPALDDLYVRLYGDADTPYSDLALLASLFIDTDLINDSGDSISPPPWQAEDALVFHATLNVSIRGSYYNIFNTEPLRYVEGVTAFPSIGELEFETITEEYVLSGTDDDAPWPGFDYEDDLVVFGIGKPSGVDTLN